MATMKKIPRTKLNTVMKSLPAPVQEHCKRCKLLAAFLVERLKTVDWFLDARLNPATIIDAVFYHDIGKTRVGKDYLYAVHCTAKQKRRRYQAHALEGVDAVQEAAIALLSEYGPRSFERYLEYAITQHHERMDGTGFPRGLAAHEIAPVARITAVVDAFDNLLFVGNTEYSFDAACVGLEAMAGKALDGELVIRFLEDREVLRDYVNAIIEKEQNKRRTDAYGMRLLYYPIVNVRENETVGYRAEVWINDPFYGLVDPHVFLPVAQSSGQITKFERIAFEKLCYEMDQLLLAQKEIPVITYGFSGKHFAMKNFYRNVMEILQRYEIPAKQFCIAIQDAEMSDQDTDWLGVLDQFHDEGFDFCIEEFGDSSFVLSLLDRLPVDRVCMKREFSRRILENPKTYSVVSGLSKMLFNLHIDVMVAGVSSDTLEAQFLRAGAKLARGERYGEPLTLRELKTVLELAPEDDEGGDAV